MKIVKKEELLYIERRIRMEIGEISYGYLDPKWSFRHLRAAFTRVYFPLEGTGVLSFGDRTIELIPGNIYVVPAGLDFSCACPARLDKIYVHLTLTHPDGCDVFSGIESCLILKNCADITQKFDALCQKRDVRSVLKLKLLLYDILCRALSLTAPTDSEIKVYSECTKAALAYIDKHLRAGLHIQEIADALFVSKQGLQKAFKADLDKPLGGYIDGCLMARAELLLLDRALSVKDVGDRLGFCDQFYFSRKFSQTHGISPRQFRRIHQVFADETIVC
ncbi:MAG: helix-turn-helix domain-containing protein [Clostridia bacterium]|nr:helix-turn-helix domain-containing protein [Clostridia bacterium]